MAKGFKIALPGFNAETDNDPTHFSVFVDGSEDHIIVKEKARATVTVPDASTDDIVHGLAYVPLSTVFVESDTGEFTWVHGGNTYEDFDMHMDASKIYLVNEDSVDRAFTYIIYHDEV